ncbi:methyltransferase domain-containing protein [Actinokineospora sp. HUAS TT18]|uniref:class I SAM-dependent methyltransferase n=1 Tax=Actinokineospora sp. HUAS TT18 TaxID=3447451 RepID=UPI003F52087D
MEDSELFTRRAASFGAVAPAYAEHRPDYPAAALEWILGDRAEVLDLAAGTGLLTGNLLAMGRTVTAVDHDPEMLAELGRRFPAVRALLGSADRIPLPEASVDAVVVGHAFHWFNTEAALTEITRVLRPGGVFAVLWNHDDTAVPWVAGLVELTHTSVGQILRPGWVGPEHPRLSPAEERRFPHTQWRTIEDFIATLGTHSQVSLAPAHEREALFDRVRAYLSSRTETANGFDRPLQTLVFRSVVAFEDQT